MNYFVLPLSAVPKSPFSAALRSASNTGNVILYRKGTPRGKPQRWASRPLSRVGLEEIQGGRRAKISLKRGSERSESRSGSCSNQARMPRPVPTARSSVSRALSELPAMAKLQAAW